MEFVTVEGRTLKHALAPAIDTVDRRYRIPILGYVRLSHSAAGLQLMATDLDNWVSTSVDPIDGACEWQVCLDAKALDGIARVAGVSSVRIEKLPEPPHDPNSKERRAMHSVRVSIDADDAVYELPYLPADDFPEPPFQAADRIETFTNGMLGSVVDKVRFCVSSEETRYYLNGVCWRRGPDGSSVVATDGHRLARCIYSSEASAESSRIIPRKTIGVICKHMVGADVRVFEATDKKCALVFEAPGLRLSSKLIDGTFPDIDRVIPKGHVFEFTVQRADLVSALQKTTAMGRLERGRAIKFDHVDGRIAVELKRPDFGSARVKTAAAWPDPVDGVLASPFGFNGRYLLDILAGCDGEVALRSKGAGDPFLISDADTTMTRVLMPMRV